MLYYLFTWLCGGMAFRAIARTNGMLKPENLINRPLFLHKNRVVPVLVTIAFFGVLAASCFLGWYHSGIFGVVLNPIQVFFASILWDLAIAKGFFRKLQYSFFLNPIVHLYILPWVFILGVVLILLSNIQ